MDPKNEDKSIYIKETSWMKEITLDFKGTHLRLKGDECQTYTVKEKIPKEMLNDTDFTDCYNRDGRYFSPCNMEQDTLESYEDTNCRIIHTACLNRSDKNKIAAVRERIKQYHGQYFETAEFLGIKYDYEQEEKANALDIKWVINKPPQKSKTPVVKALKAPLVPKPPSVGIPLKAYQRRGRSHYFIYKNKKYTVETGKKGGLYIVIDGHKKYLSHLNGVSVPETI